MAEVPAEFNLIARIRARAGTRDDVLLGIGDDAAILRVPAGHDLVVSTDTLNSGVHFPVETAPCDIGWKALAVNLSDLAATGAEPAWCTLNLTLPHADVAWLDAFLDGFLALAAQHRVALVGGDTTRGPLSITVTAHGFVPHGAALRRDGAQVGDDVWVSGTLGDAAAGLGLVVAEAIAQGSGVGASPESPSPDEVRRCVGEPPVRASPNATAPGAVARARVGVRGEPERDPARFTPHPSPLPMGEGEQQRGDDSWERFLRARLDRPTPRVTLGVALRGIASACIDVSDGLLSDLGHVVRASGVGAVIDFARLPESPALRSVVVAAETRKRMQLGGGDDYELCFTAPPARSADLLAAAAGAGVPVTRIGGIERESGLRVSGDDGNTRDMLALGYVHFATPSGDATPA